MNMEHGIHTLRQRFDRVCAHRQQPTCKLSLQEKTQLIDAEARFSFWERSIGELHAQLKASHFDRSTVRGSTLEQQVRNNLETLNECLQNIERIILGLGEDC